MAGDRKDPDFPGFPFTLPFPFAPPELWVHMWVHMMLGPYRDFLVWYKRAIEEWNKEDVDGSLRHLSNELMYASLNALKTSREVRSKLTQFQLESIDHYLKILDRFAGSGEHHRPS